MRTEGNVLEVLRALEEKRFLLLAGNPAHEAIRPALQSLSGIQRGTQGGGEVTALEELGHTHTFDDLAGTSTGIPQIFYFAAHQAWLGRKIYWKECTYEFISWRRGLTPRIFGGGPVLSARYLSKVFRGSLDQQAIIDSRSRVHIALTLAGSGEGYFTDAKVIKPDLVHGMEAGISVPGLSEGEVMVDGMRFIDGGGGVPFGAMELQARTGCTHLLILANAAGPKTDSLAVKMLSGFILRKLSPGAHKAFMTRHERFNDEYSAWKKNPTCEWGIIFDEEGVGSYEQNPTKIYNASERARRHLTALFIEAVQG